MNIAVIPARGGSTRIPKKNIKEFAGKPIIHYPIKASLESGVFDHVIVSTDSEEIMEAARKAGASAPFKRPAELSENHVNTTDVMEHAIHWAEKNLGKVENLCCVYATAPFIRSSDIKSGFDILKSNGVSSVFSVTTYDFTIFRGFKIDENGYLKMFWPEHEFTDSQNLPEAYHDAGLFYWLDSEKFLKTKRIFADDAMPVRLPRVLVQDIDTQEDWETAEIMFEACKKRGILQG